MADALRRPFHAPALVASSRSAALARLWPILAITLITFAIRAATFGNPNLETDEQLYLLIGDRLLHGQLPYVDLWDRKPIGLFLFYAGVRLFGGTGIVEYQVAAAACVAATAALIQAMARRHAGEFGALVAAFAYVLFLNPLHGTGGQSPVIYNLLTACAAWCAFRANDTADPRRIARLALLAMAACGIAIQFKYTPVVEGVAIGCYFVWRLDHVGVTRPRLALTAAAMIGVALLPTIAVLLAYAWAGHLDALVQSNFVSIFRRTPFPEETRIRQRFIVAVVTAPLLAMVPVALAHAGRAGPAERRDLPLMLLWCAAAAAGFAMLRDFYDFYFITVLPPLLVLIARAVTPRPFGIGVAAGLIAWPLLIAPPSPARTRFNRDAIDALATAIRPHVRDRCLYVADGPTILYLLTNACAPTRFLYPDHLTNPTEATALGVDPAVEVVRLLATHPGAIVTANRPLIPRVNPLTHALVAAAIARDYALVTRVAADRVYSVYALRRPVPVRHAPR